MSIEPIEGGGDISYQPNKGQTNMTSYMHETEGQRRRRRHRELEDDDIDANGVVKDGGVVRVPMLLMDHNQTEPNAEEKRRIVTDYLGDVVKGKDDSFVDGAYRQMKNVPRRETPIVVDERPISQPNRQRLNGAAITDAALRDAQAALKDAGDIACELSYRTRIADDTNAWRRDDDAGARAIRHAKLDEAMLKAQELRDTYNDNLRRRAFADAEAARPSKAEADAACEASYAAMVHEMGNAWRNPGARR